MKTKSYKELASLIRKLSVLWSTIHRRCNDPKCVEYPYYGGKGVKVSKNWTNYKVGFIVWCLEHGWEPELEIDRINNDGNYTEFNTRFSTHCRNLGNRGQQNKKRGFKGRVYDDLPMNVTFEKVHNMRNFPYKVIVKREGVTYNVGNFATVEEAVAARDKTIKRVERKLYGTER